MEQPWYCRMGDEQRGPFTFQQLKRAAARGELKLTSLVRRADIASWTEAGQIPDLWPRAAAIPPDEPPAGVPIPPPPAPPPALAATVGGSPARPRPVAVSPVGPPAIPPGAPTTKLAKPQTAAERRQQARRKMLLLVGGGIGTLVLVVALVIVVQSLTDSKAQVAVKATEPSAAMPLATDLPPASAAAAAAPLATAVNTGANTGAPLDAARTVAIPAAAVAAPDAAVVKQIVQSTKPWRNIQSSPGVSSRSARLQIVGVWFAPRSPKSPAAAESVSPPPDDGAAVEAKVICVELRVSNLDRNDAPLTYSSWNMASAKAAQPSVVCVDSQDQALALVPLDAYPNELRQNKPLRIASKQAASDLLVFEAPRGEFEDLRLGLRATAINAGDIYLGFRIPHEAILAEKPVELASGDAPAETGDVPAAAGDAETPVPQTAPASAPLPREETIDDLRRQIAETAKSRQAEKDAERKKQEEETAKGEPKEQP